MQAKETHFVSHFVVQMADVIEAIACVPCGPRRSLSMGASEDFEVLKIVCCCTIKNRIAAYAGCGLSF